MADTVDTMRCVGMRYYLKFGQVVQARCKHRVTTSDYCWQHREQDYEAQVAWDYLEHAHG